MADPETESVAQYLRNGIELGSVVRHCPFSRPAVHSHPIVPVCVLALHVQREALPPNGNFVEHAATALEAGLRVPEVA
eukprot:CAMPEP_0115579280 /NCGR_PEP_ID=MMETSP0272-20121206/4025_1 /TAXON_ID=71861 /ORGANISM="Scrippsiella trochoidea, Strain CCMP3099" /LENGTH=77 /DNA_ID=CAMNT_0003014155 /DNA_START=337 /DNA_END=570 /DNA_ORIENTATION=+